MKKELINLIKKLIVFDSTSENIKAKKDCLNFVKDWFEKAEIDVKQFPHSESPSILANLKGNINKTFLFVAHLDIVPANNELLTLKQKGNKLFGRGVRDNKGCVVMLMFLLREMKRIEKKVNIQFLITTDEEVGGLNGTGRLVKKGLFNGVDAVFIPDAGEEDTVIIKEKGVMHYLLEIRGQSAHGSRPWQGENALIQAINLFKEIEKIFEKDEKSKDYWYSTVNLGILKGGDAINQVPDETQIGIDIRFTEVHNKLDIRKKVMKIIEKYNAKIIRTVEADMLNSDPTNQLIKHYCKIMEKVLNKKISLKNAHGASDARFFNYLNVPVWLQYPKGGGQHSREEWVDIDSIINFIKGFKIFLKSLNDKKNDYNFFY